VFEALLTSLAFERILEGKTGEPCVLFQFVTVDGTLIRVLGLADESDTLNKLLQVPEEKGS
jgi:hypothetical protein